MEYYNYKIIVESESDIYDGDTLRVNIDLGFGCWLKNQSVRLYGIDTPEIRGDERTEGLIARDWLRHKIKEVDGQLSMRTYKDSQGKYGRWLAELFIDDVNINQELLRLGLAVPYD